MKTLYLGNLARQVSDLDLTKICSVFGEVNWANVVRAKIGDLSQGFGFVEMESPTHAEAAISGLNGSVYRGKRISVRQAKPTRH